MMLLKCCIQYVSKFEKLSNDTRLEKVTFHSNPREGQCQRIVRLPYNWVHFTYMKVMLNFEETEKPEIKLSTLARSQRNQGNSRKIIYFYLIGYGKAFDYVGHNKLCKIIKEMGVPNNLTCLLRNLYASQLSTIRNRHGTTN